MPQIRKPWKDVGRAHGWKHSRAPSVKWLWREKSTEAVLVFLRSIRVECISTTRKLPEERCEEGHEAGAGGEGEEGGPGPPDL